MDTKAEQLENRKSRFASSCIKNKYRFVLLGFNKFSFVQLKSIEYTLKIDLTMLS